MAISGGSCPGALVFEIQIMMRVPHDSVASLVEAANESWRICPCGCRERSRMFLGTTKADKEAAFLLLSEAFNSDQQHLDHAARFATSLLAEARVELQVQPAFALSTAKGPAERTVIFEQYGSTTEDKHLKDCERLWYGPRLLILEPGRGRHVRESSPFPIWDKDAAKEWATGLSFNTRVGKQPLYLLMLEVMPETVMEATNKRKRVD